MAEIAGLKLIVPTSVVSATVSATGKVSFNAVTSFSINGCFSSTYDNYLFVIHMTDAGASTIQYRLRASGSDASGTNYTRQRLRANGSTVDAARATSQAQGSALDANDTIKSGAHFYIYGPALAQPTASRGVGVDAFTGALIMDYAITHSLSTAYDGITFFSAGTANMNGTMTIYGLSQ